MSRRGNNSNSGNMAQNTSTNTSITEESSTFISSELSSALVKDSANLNYSYVPGSKVFSNAGFTGNTPSLPGIIAFPVIPNIGGEQTNSTPINLAANMIYRKVRAANSGAKNYDANNLMIYIMSLDSIYSFHSWMCRLYGALRWFTPYNRYTPEALVKAMGADYTDLISNIANFKRYIDLFGMKANTLAIPGTIPFIVNHLKMYAKIYMDKKSERGQMYMFNPDGFYTYNENIESGNKIGTLTYKRLRDSMAQFLTVNEIIAYGNTLLNDLMQSEDLLIMSGDIIKAYEGQIVMIPEISEDYSNVPVYDMDVLTAIHNAHFLHGDPKVGDITWDVDGRIDQRITINEMDVRTVSDPLIIDQHKDAPSIEDNVNALRFTYDCNPASTTIRTCGPELLKMPLAFYMSDDGVNFKALDLRPTVIQSGTDPTGTVLGVVVDSILKTATILSSFDMAPKYMVKTTIGSGASAENKNLYALWEVYNPTIVEPSTYDNIMLAYFMAEFGIK